MATVKLISGTKTALASSSIATLASANYCVSSVYNTTTNQPLDLVVEVTVTSSNVVAGNKQVVVFAQGSYDNVSWQSGPSTGSTTTDEPALTLVGFVGTPLQATTVSLASVTITGTGGQFSCTSTAMSVGQLVWISGTFGGTGSITGYVNPTPYIISATNGTTTFTLVSTVGAAIVTTSGTPTGLTYTQYTANVERKSFSVGAAYSGTLPPYVQIVTKNDLGVALTAGYLSTAEISATVA